MNDVTDARIGKDSRHCILKLFLAQSGLGKDGIHNELVRFDARILDSADVRVRIVIEQQRRTLFQPSKPDRARFSA